VLDEDGNDKNAGKDLLPLRHASLADDLQVTVCGALAEQERLPNKAPLPP